jgi:hypothetical protein
MITDDMARTLSTEPQQEPGQLFTYLNDGHRHFWLPLTQRHPAVRLAVLVPPQIRFAG